MKTAEHGFNLIKTKLNFLSADAPYIERRRFPDGKPFARPISLLLFPTAPNPERGQSTPLSLRGGGFWFGRGGNLPPSLQSSPKACARVCLLLEGERAEWWVGGCVGLWVWVWEGNWKRCAKEKVEGCAAINYGSLPPTFSLSLGGLQKQSAVGSCRVRRCRRG